MRYRSTISFALITMFITGTVIADLLVYELPQEDAEGAAVRQANFLCEVGSFDFNDLNWNDIFTIADPLDILGTPNNEIPAGFILGGVWLQSDIGGGIPRGANGMVGIPFFQQNINLVASNIFTDGLSIIVDDQSIEAVEVEPALLLGVDEVMEAFVYDQDGILLGSFIVDAGQGQLYGVIATEGDTIGRITLFDAEEGAEGVVSARFHSTFLPGGCWITNGPDGDNGGYRRPRSVTRWDGGR